MEKVFALLAFLTLCLHVRADRAELQTALAELDRTLLTAPNVDRAYLDRIEGLRRAWRDARTPREQFSAARRIAAGYRFFVADSSMAWIERAMQAAKSINDPKLINRALIDKVDILARSGLLHEAMQLMDSVVAPTSHIDRLDRQVLLFDVNQYMSEFTQGTPYFDQFSNAKFVAADSIIGMTEADDFKRISVATTKLIEQEGRTDDARRMLLDAIRHYQPGQREYSVLAAELGYALLNSADTLEAQVWLARSARSDILGAVKETMSMRSLAELRYRDGDVERAHDYLTKSIADAGYYSARLRNTQAAQLLPLINQAYNELQSRQQFNTRILLLLTLLTLFIIAGAYIFIRRQLRLTRTAHAETERANRALKEAMSDLEQANTALTDANTAKRQYLVRFMRMCNDILLNQEKDSNRLSLMAKTGKLEQVLSMIGRRTEIIRTSRELYSTFDEAFRNIYPEFFTRVNSLLTEPIPLPDDITGLTTEQRLLALIHLGITDPREISTFLRSSLSTIYTYRSRLRNRSTCPDRFEEEITRL